MRPAAAAIHFSGVEQLDGAGLAKSQALAPIAAVHQGMSPFPGTACQLIAIEGGGHADGGTNESRRRRFHPGCFAYLRTDRQAETYCHQRQ